MKKFLFATSALALTVAMSPAVTNSAQAQEAPTKSPYCKMAKGQKNLVAWNAYYHCLGSTPQAAQETVRGRRTVAQARLRSGEDRPFYAQARPEETKSPYCNMAKGQKNLVSWNAEYHCLGPAPEVAQTSVQARPANTYDYVASAAPGGIAAGDLGWCAAHFRSYNPATGMYLGYDGSYHPCP